MLIWPAIDLLGGRAVRLLRGRRESAEEVGGGDPLAIAERWRAAGRAHVVDLDGAFDGGVRQADLVARIAAIVPVQAGGGLRSEEDVARLLAAGVSRVVVGTRALVEPAFLDTLLARFGSQRIVVAADISDGRVAIRGWTESLPTGSAEMAARLAAQGVRHVLVTAVERDGTMEGPDTSALDVFAAAGLSVLASGGIGSLDDLRRTARYSGVVVGKALYAGRFTLEEALAVAGDGC